MPVHSLFKTLIKKSPVQIELKNTLVISGVVEDIDTFLNFKISSVTIDKNPLNIPMHTTGSLFVRGSSVRGIWIEEADVQIKKLESATRKSMLYKKLTA
ncbi:U6 snRNA-associated Sm-like protein LSm2 [Nematocida major]|uniref:U6 snRNA-associated Sm-like protein LSm2 n=1 Tax=Nematocida major TaxID=1912982 RepID=UPI0020087001|nr:U6 snRNA-associated Sm-like protein LSm2 [Nematocida major]KAH9385613.1 U6 snRNA-associated Sm-like protein LSm2 [Nematocida major]